MKRSLARGIAALAFLGAVTAAFVLHNGFGSWSAFGIGSLSFACPVGVLEAMVGIKEVTLRGLACLAVVIVLAFVVGKAFCAWGCPTPWICRALRRRKKSACGHCASLQNCASAKERVIELAPVGGKRDGRLFDSRHFVLGGALLASFIAGFPVFCIVCPVGLAFAALLAFGQALFGHTFSWGIIVFPAVILAELLLCKSWCHTFCPIGALLSLLSTKRVLRPRVNEEKCTRTSGVDCRTCVRVCPEEIDPHSDIIPECTQCGLCADACPAKAISFLPQRANKNSGAIDAVSSENDL